MHFFFVCICFHSGITMSYFIAPSSIFSNIRLWACMYSPRLALLLGILLCNPAKVWKEKMKERNKHTGKKVKTYQ